MRLRHPKVKKLAISTQRAMQLFTNGRIWIGELLLLSEADD